MSKQSVALRLADALEISSNHGMRREAAAELRRLHGLDFALRDCELALNKMATKYMDASDQRDALLEALRKHVELHDGDCICEDCAAIAKAKEQQ